MGSLLKALAMFAACAVACGHESDERGVAAIMPGPRPAQELAVVEANAKCEVCHVSIAKEWRSSRHHLAATNAQYQAAHAIEPFVFCQACHAPGAVDAEVSGPRAELGIGCINCHPTEGGATLTGTGRPPIFSLSHPVVRSKEYSGVGACAKCHQFAFPQKGRDAEAFMQRTVTEHAQSPFANIACADCHMPLVGSFGNKHRSHAFASPRDPARQRDALHIEAKRDGQKLAFAIEPNRVGHAFPTGDLFRRLTVEARARDSTGMVKSVRRRYLARHFARQRQSSGGLALVEIADDRPGAECTHNACGVQFVLDLGVTARNLPFEFSVAYERVQHLQYGSEDLAVVAERVVLAEGTR